MESAKELKQTILAHWKKHEPDLLAELKAEGPKAADEFAQQLTEQTLSLFDRLQAQGMSAFEAWSMAMREIALAPIDPPTPYEGWEDDEIPAQPTQDPQAPPAPEAETTLSPMTTSWAAAAQRQSSATT